MSLDLPRYIHLLFLFYYFANLFLKASFDHAVSLAGFVLQGTASVATASSFNVSKFEWSGDSTFGNNSASGILSSNGVLSISGAGSTKHLNATSLYNYGTANWFDGDVVLSSGASLYILKNSVFSILIIILNSPRDIFLTFIINNKLLSS